MMNIKCFFILLFISSIISCNKDVSYFNGGISFFEGFPQTDSLIGFPIEFNDIYTGNMYVYDSIVGFLSNKYPGHCLSVFNLNSGSHLMNLCKKGRGPNEFYSLRGSQQFEYKGTDICIWLREAMKERLYLVNLTQSAKVYNTVIDSIVDIKWFHKELFYSPFSFSFALEDNEVLVKNQAYKKDIESSDYAPPAYYLLDIANKIKKTDIILYKRPLINRNQKNIWFGDYFHSIDKIKPDKTKIAMGMEMLCQINILQLSSGELKGYRMLDTVDFTDLEEDSSDNLKGYYLELCVDDFYIYAFYSGHRQTDYENYYTSKEVHVFDWEGNPVRKLILSDEGDYLRLDPVHKKLYVKNDAEDVFCYDVQDLYEIE